MDLIIRRAFIRCGHRLNGMELILKRDFIGRSQSRRAVLKATLSTEQEGNALSFELLIRMEILRLNVKC